MTTIAELDAFAVDVVRIPGRAHAICNNYTDAHNSYLHLAPKLDRAAHELVAHRQSAIAASRSAGTFKTTGGLGISQQQQQQQQQQRQRQQQQQQQQRRHVESAIAASRSAGNLRQRHPVQQQAAQRGPAAGIRGAMQQDAQEETSDDDDDADVDRAMHPLAADAAPSFAGATWTTLYFAIACWVVNVSVHVVGVYPHSTTTIAAVVETSSAVPQLFRICFAALAVSKKGVWWALLAIGLNAAWWFNFFDGVDPVIQHVFTAVFLLCLRVWGTALPNKVAVFGATLSAAYVAAHWSTVFQPVAECSTLDGVLEHLGQLAGNDDWKHLFDLDRMGAVLVGLSADLLIGSFGAAGHEGVSVGLMAIVVGQGAFEFSSAELNIAELVSVGMLFLFHDLLQRLPHKISTLAALLLIAQGVRTELFSFELCVHALSVLFITQLFRWCSMWSGCKAVFGVLAFAAAIAVQVIYTLDANHVTVFGVTF